MHVFIPGGAGYVGSLLIPALIEAGYEVTVYDLFLQGEAIFEPIQDHPKLSLVKGDVQDLKLMEEALNGCETILHLACSLENLETTSFESFVQIAKRKIANRFIFTSSFAVYGNVKNRTEEASPYPLSSYGKYKNACEKILMEHNNTRFSCSILRLGSVFGAAPGWRPQRNPVETGPFEYSPWLHIRDLVEVYLQLLKTPSHQTNGEIYNVGYHSLSPTKILGQEEVFPFSSKKIEKLLNFSPRFSLEEVKESAEENPLTELLKRQKSRAAYRY